jgi:hypothetical protein
MAASHQYPEHGACAVRPTGGRGAEQVPGGISNQATIS